MVTTQGLMLDPKFLPKNGPKGTYSHFWISRALQSLKSTIPKMYSSASSALMRWPNGLPSPVMKAISSSKSMRTEGPNVGASAPGAMR